MEQYHMKFVEKSHHLKRVPIVVVFAIIICIPE